MNKKFLILILTALALFGMVFLFRTPLGADISWNVSSGGTLLLPLVVIAALVDSINPCAFSILFLTIAFLFSIGKVRNSVLKIGGVYILGIFIVYILIGLGILQALEIFNVPNFMGKVGASLIILLGIINIINDLFPAFPLKLKIPTVSHKKIAALMEKATMPTAFFMGVFVGLCEFPCTGGPYLMILGLLHDQGTYVSGFMYLILYNILFVSPLILILLIAANPVLLEKIKTWKSANMKNSRFIAGIIMTILGIIIFNL